MTAEDSLEPILAGGHGAGTNENFETEAEYVDSDMRQRLEEGVS